MTPDADRDKKIEKLRAQIDNLAKEDLILVAIEAGGTRSYSAHLPAHHHLREIFGSSSCYKTDILVLSGRDKTDNTGVAKIPINSLLCGVVTEGDGLPPGWNFVMIREPNFVATPQSPLPCFATVVIHSTIRQSRSVPLYGRDDQSFNTEPLT